MIDIADHFDFIEADFQSIYHVDLGGYVMGADGPVWIMAARSARWFMWRLALLATEPASRFHAMVDQRRKDAQQEAPRLAAVPGNEDY